jgi:predicted nucleic acid-binding protein
VIYLDSSVAMARLLFELRSPPLPFWDQPMVSSRLLEYEVWNRMDAYDPNRSNQNAVRALLTGVQLMEMDRAVLARALEPWRTPLRTLDALHLATADYLRQQGEPIEVASYDNRLLDAARAIGIPMAEL